MPVGMLRGLLCAALCLIARPSVAAAAGSDYPTHPIRYLVAFAPGGINDIMARIVAQKLNRVLGTAGHRRQPARRRRQPRRGLVARSTPDGYTFMNISTAHTISQTLYTKLDYSLERDLTPVVVLGNSPLIMVVNAGMPAKNLAELVDWARKER